MSRVVRSLVIAATAALLWMPVPAHAETWVSPFVGGVFGVHPGTPNNKLVFGGDVGGLSGGPFGAEVDFGYHPHFFGDTAAIGSNYLLDLMGNVLIGAPTTLVGRAGVRPYAAIGLGLIRAHVQNSVSGSNNDAAFDVGGGLLGYFSAHAGLKADIKYFRTVTHGTDVTDLSLDKFHYWRATIGVVLR